MGARRVGKGEIVGRVTDARGEPVVGASALITGDSPQHIDIGAETSADGAYRFDDLVPGEYTILVNAEGHVSQTGRVQVEAGAVARLHISLPD